MHSALGFVSRLACCVVVVLSGTAAGGCSALLEWNGYTGGDAGDAEAGVAETGAGDGGDGEAAAQVCGSNCGGCCKATGFCAGGQSADSCGTGGVACVDCTAGGMVCSGGACVLASTVEAGPPPPCDPNACTMRCYAFVYETGCCKSDMTCGCQVQIPTKGECM
jgi:hypothetical protein